MPCWVRRSRNMQRTCQVVERDRGACEQVEPICSGDGACGGGGSACRRRGRVLVESLGVIPWKRLEKLESLATVPEGVQRRVDSSRADSRHRQTGGSRAIRCFQLSRDLARRLSRADLSWAKSR